MKEAEDDQTTQQDLENLEVWEREWDMHFHPYKCNVLPITMVFIFQGGLDDSFATETYFGLRCTEKFRDILLLLLLQNRHPTHALGNKSRVIMEFPFVTLISDRRQNL